MNLIIQSSIYTLSKSKNLLSILTNESLSNTSVPPYYSCIGSHIRHIVDFYDCILEGFNKKSIDLTARKRDERMYKDCNYTNRCLERVMLGLKQLNNVDPEMKIDVTDDLGVGKIKIGYTLGAVLAQANNHAIHHYAIINYIMSGLKISIEDSDFGYNPTTPKKLA